MRLILVVNAGRHLGAYLHYEHAADFSASADCLRLRRRNRDDAIKTLKVVYLSSAYMINMAIYGAFRQKCVARLERAHADLY